MLDEMGLDEVGRPHLLGLAVVPITSAKDPITLSLLTIWVLICERFALSQLNGILRTSGVRNTIIGLSQGF